jgi:SpoVK/Ycf46/Vps4 family AAA+-type ATPase
MKTKKNTKKSAEDIMDLEIQQAAEKFTFDTEKEPTTLLEAIDNVSAIVHGMDVMDCDLFDPTHCCGNNLDYLSKRLHITPIQAILLSVCIEEGPTGITFNDFSTSLSISKARSMGLAPHLDGMVRKRMLTTSNNYRGEVCYDMPQRIIKTLTDNLDYQLPQRKAKSDEEVLDLYRCCIGDAKKENMPQSIILEDIAALLKENKKIHITKEISKMKLNVVSAMVLLFFCDRLVNYEDSVIDISDLSCLFTNKQDFYKVRTDLRSGHHELIEKGIIENAFNNGLGDICAFSLSETAREKLLLNIKLNLIEEKVDGLLNSAEISPKELFYTDKVGKQVGKLRGFLDNEKYKVLVERMKERFNRSGLTCLMYGGPGTGKTETVYQLARQTGRDIMAIDVPQIKSKWVGESEKNIKAVFEKYRAMVAKAEVAPILLFNEADAIIGVRMSGAERSTDKMENSIQNIILQEMETLDGIMIATTNLTENLDSAFERRFLYKVEFERPDASVREHIWHTMLPELNDNECKTLAEGFDFSGGQIENVARKYAIDGILGDLGQTDRLTELTSLCSEERINDTYSDRRRIGFVA